MYDKKCNKELLHADEHLDGYETNAFLFIVSYSTAVILYALVADPILFVLFCTLKLASTSLLDTYKLKFLTEYYKLKKIIHNTL